MSGILYGIGTGPGDPELMTIKAVKIIKACEVIAIPVSDLDLKEPFLEIYESKKDKMIDGKSYDYLKKCVAYQIALPNVPEMEKKDILYVPMPMIKEKKILKKIHDLGAKKIGELLQEEKNVGFLTLGDPTVYSTYLYIHKRIIEEGFRAEMVSGVPSFCASAARMNIGLVENRQQLHVIPASYGVEEAISLSGTKVLMKAGRKMREVKEAVRKYHQGIQMIEKCGMEGEKIYTSIDEVPDESSYYSLMIIKE